jgi:hypothetical protein
MDKSPNNEVKYFAALKAIKGVKYFRKVRKRKKSFAERDQIYNQPI